MNNLARYHEKRDFTLTPEPSGEGSSTERPGMELPPGAAGRFVVQEHHARRLHWDLRLEERGVLKSWAVPKGVPLEKGSKRLAVETEDHPLEYIDFYGVIPEDQYGAGVVEIWDSGVYGIVERTDDKYYVVLMGQKLRGAYMIVRTRGEQWLLWKRLDEADVPLVTTG